MSCIELYGGFHTTLRQQCNWVLLQFIGLSIGVCVGVGQCERTITPSYLRYMSHFSQRTYIWAKPKKWQFLSPPLSTDLEGGTPSELMCPTQTISICLYTFSHRFAQNRFFYKLIFFNPINFDLKFHLKMVLEWWDHSFIVKNKK